MKKTKKSLMEPPSVVVRIPTEKHPGQQAEVTELCTLRGVRWAYELWLVPGPESVQ